MPDLHPCLRVFGGCHRGAKCPFFDLPREACLRFAKGNCHKKHCKEPHYSIDPVSGRPVHHSAKQQHPSSDAKASTKNNQRKQGKSTGSKNATGGGGGGGGGGGPAPPKKRTTHNQQQLQCECETLMERVEDMDDEETSPQRIIALFTDVTEFVDQKGEVLLKKRPLLKLLAELLKKKFQFGDDSLNSTNDNDAPSTQAGPRQCVMHLLQVIVDREYVFMDVTNVNRYESTTHLENWIYVTEAAYKQYRNNARIRCAIRDVCNIPEDKKEVKQSVKNKAHALYTDVVSFEKEKQAKDFQRREDARRGEEDEHAARADPQQTDLVLGKLPPPVPTLREVRHPPDSSSLPPTLVSFDSMLVHIDTQYQLYRADFSLDICQGIHWAAEKLAFKGSHRHHRHNSNAREKNHDVNLYENVRFESHHVNRADGVQFMFSLDMTQFGPNWKSIRLRNRFMHGNFVCLSDDKFQKRLFFGTLAQLPLKKGQRSAPPQQGPKIMLAVTFEDSVFEEIKSNSTFSMIESRTFFLPYKRVLECLRTLDVDNLPPRIVDALQGQRTHTPDYVQRMNDTFGGFVVEDIVALTDAGAANNKQFDVLRNDHWETLRPWHPDDEKSSEADTAATVSTFCHSLDRSQCEAMKIMFSNNIALVQGTPGTGKTFIGAKYIQIMLKNWTRFSRILPKCPIVVLCFTNHALDSLLLDVLRFCDGKDIVRVGASSTEAEIQALAISKKQREMRMNKFLHRDFALFDDVREELEALLQLRNASPDGRNPDSFDRALKIVRQKSVLFSDVLDLVQNWKDITLMHINVLEREKAAAKDDGWNSLNELCKGFPTALTTGVADHDPLGLGSLQYFFVDTHQMLLPPNVCNAKLTEIQTLLNQHHEKINAARTNANTRFLRDLIAPHLETPPESPEQLSAKHFEEAKESIEDDLLVQQKRVEQAREEVQRLKRLAGEVAEIRQPRAAATTAPIGGNVNDGATSASKKRKQKNRKKRKNQEVDVATTAASTATSDGAEQSTSAMADVPGDLDSELEAAQAEVDRFFTLERDLTAQLAAIQRATAEFTSFEQHYTMATALFHIRMTFLADVFFRSKLLDISKSMYDRLFKVDQQLNDIRKTFDPSLSPNRLFGTWIQGVDYCHSKVQLKADKAIHNEADSTSWADGHDSAKATGGDEDTNNNDALDMLDQNEQDAREHDADNADDGGLQDLLQFARPHVGGGGGPATASPSDDDTAAATAALHDIVIPAINAAGGNFSKVHRDVRATASHAFRIFLEHHCRSSIQGQFYRLDRCKKQQQVEDARLNHMVLREHKIVGATTVGAARILDALVLLKPAIVVVEECAEVLESHLLATLTPSIQHLILIGDHRQLKPKTNNHDCDRKGLGMSLMERLVKAKLPHTTLNVQRRMHPGISIFTKPYYLEHERVEIIDHPATDLRLPVLGVSRAPRAYFVDSTGKGAGEQMHNGMSSPYNAYEAELVVLIALYLGHHHRPFSTITIIVGYTGQLMKVFDAARTRRLPIFKSSVDPKTGEKTITDGVRIVTVDSYQGEENDFTILSLTRTDMPGFMKIENRACVMLSRARRGLYIVGCKALFTKPGTNPIWRDALEHMKRHNCIGDVFPAECTKHHTDLSFNDFKSYNSKVQPNGGCTQPCLNRMSCGHTCAQMCHAQECESFKCMEPCQRVGRNCTLSPDTDNARTCDHPCKKYCHEICGPCEELVSHVLPCGHTKKVQCHRKEEEHFCKELVTKHHDFCGHDVTAACSLWRKKELFAAQGKKSERDKADVEIASKCKGNQCKTPLPCGHLCTKRCHAADEHNHSTCTRQQDVTLPCGHEVTMSCAKLGDAPKMKCKEVCGQVLSADDCAYGHKCTGRCGDCRRNGQHKLCTEEVMKQLPCGHKQSVPCHQHVEDAVCSTPCTVELKCGHICGGTCSSCSVKNSHGPCKHKCDRVQPCGHTCNSGICSSACPPCINPCEYRCAHKNCTNLPRKKRHDCSHHHKVMAKCVEPCAWVCHPKCNKKLACSAECSSMCTREMCKNRCPALLPCGHQCIGLCGERCPEVCDACFSSAEPASEVHETQRALIGRISNMYTLDFGDDNEPASLFGKNQWSSVTEAKKDDAWEYLLVPLQCGCLHFIGELQASISAQLDNFAEAIAPPKCPSCRAVIFPDDVRACRSNLLRLHQKVAGVQQKQVQLREDDEAKLDEIRKTLKQQLRLVAGLPDDDETLFENDSASQQFDEPEMPEKPVYRDKKAATTDERAAHEAYVKSLDGTSTKAMKLVEWLNRDFNARQDAHRELMTVYESAKKKVERQRHEFDLQQQKRVDAILSAPAATTVLGNSLQKELARFILRLLDDLHDGEVVDSQQITHYAQYATVTKCYSEMVCTLRKRQEVGHKRGDFLPLIVESMLSTRSVDLPRQGWPLLFTEFLTFVDTNEQLPSLERFVRAVRFGDLAVRADFLIPAAGTATSPIAQRTQDCALQNRVRQATFDTKVAYKEACAQLTSSIDAPTTPAINVLSVLEDEVKALEKLWNIEQPSRQLLQELTTAVGVTAGHWYQCPNGHFYVIGDCGGAMMTSKCPDCGAIIGGQQHQVNSGNRSAAHLVQEGAQAAWPQ